MFLKMAEMKVRKRNKIEAMFCDDCVISHFQLDVTPELMFLTKVHEVRLRLYVFRQSLGCICWSGVVQSAHEVVRRSKISTQMLRANKPKP